MYSNSWRRARAGLDAGLLVDAQHHRALGRLTVQRADRVDLLAKLRIGAVQPLPHAVRAHLGCLQDALQMTAADVLDHPTPGGALAQLIECRRGPAPRFGRLARQGQQLQPLHVVDTTRTAWTLRFAQAGHALIGDAPAPH
jgi:hypothetical protein